MSFLHSTISRLFGEARAWQLYERVSRAARIQLGKANATRFRRRQDCVRPVLRVAFDTQIFQICQNERGGWYSTGKVMWGQQEVETGFYGPYNPTHPDALSEQIPYVYAICELAREKALEIIEVPSVRAERSKAPDKHHAHFACQPLLHDVRVVELNFACPKLTFAQTSYGPRSSRPDEQCQFDYSRYGIIYSHLSGKKQQKDGWHFMICDAYGIDVFITCDEPFLKGYAQICAKIEMLGVRTKVYSPKEFCHALGVRPISPSIANPKTAFFGSQK